jgi:hypothetical protein
MIDDNKLFTELKHICKAKDVYSVREIAVKMGINYDYIALVASQDPEKHEILQLCRGYCECNAIHAGLLGKLPLRKVHKYWLENDEGYARDFGHEQFFDDEK